MSILQKDKADISASAHEDIALIDPCIQRDPLIYHHDCNYTEKETIDGHLILCHIESGDLYSSIIPGKQEQHTAQRSSSNYSNCSSVIFESGNTWGRDSKPQQHTDKMADAPGCFLRWLITILHAVTCLAAGFCFIFSLLLTMFSDQCLPGLVDMRGKAVSPHHGFSTVCHTVVYGLGAISGLSLLFSLTAWCIIKRPVMAYMSFMLTSCMAAFAVFGGSTFLVHYLLWCDSISQNVPSMYYHSTSCADAARYFDQTHESRNMTAFNNQMQIQQAVTWALFPLTLITALVYAVAMHMGTTRPQQDLDDSADTSPPRGFFQYLSTLQTRAAGDRPCDEEETMPFLPKTTG